MSDPIFVCEDTGERALNGECPIHRGDACLFDITQMRDYVNDAAGLRDKHAAKVVEMFKEAEGLRAELQDAGNLLARIHRDGGQHISKVGWKQACTDAEEIVTKGRAEGERLQACLESVAHGSPPSDWAWYACLGDYCGYGKRGDVDFVDEPGPGNVDDMFTYGVDIGRWQAAKTAREALAAQQEKA